MIFGIVICEVRNNPAIEPPLLVLGVLYGCFFQLGGAGIKQLLLLGILDGFGVVKYCVIYFAIFAVSFVETVEFFVADGL